MIDFDDSLEFELDPSPKSKVKKKKVDLGAPAASLDDLLTDAESTETAADADIATPEAEQPDISIEPRKLSEQEKTQIQKILKDWTTDHLQRVQSGDDGAPEAIPEAVSTASYDELKPVFWLRIIWAPLRFLVLWFKARKVLKQAPKISKRESAFFYARWLLYFELRLPRKQRKFFRENILDELIYTEASTRFPFYPFLAGQIKKHSPWSRLALIEVALTVVAAFRFEGDNQVIRAAVNQMIDIVNKLGLKIAQHKKSWNETTREELRELLGYQAQSRFPKFFYPGKKGLSLNLLETHSVIFRLFFFLAPAGSARLLRMLEFLRSMVGEEDVTSRLMIQIADILNDLTRLVDKELSRLSDHRKRQQKYSIIGKTVDVLARIPREEWNLYIQREADKFIRGMIWWDAFVPAVVWNKIQADVDELEAEQRLNAWYLMGFLGAALLSEDLGADKILYEGVTRICQEKEMKKLYPACIEAEIELPSFITDALYADLLPGLASDILKLSQLGYFASDKFLTYILTQDYPLSELTKLNRMFEKFSKNLALYVDLSVYLGDFLNMKLAVKANTPMNNAMFKEKMGIIMVFVSIADSLLYNEAVKFIGVPDMERSEMHQLLECFTNHTHPLTDLVYLLEEIRHRKMIDRLELIRIARLLEETCERKELVINAKVQRKLRSKFTDVARSLPTSEAVEQFFQNGLRELMELVITSHPLHKLDAILAAIKHLKYPEFVLRFLVKIAPMIVASFEKDLELTRENLQWAVSIYNKNADETAIMEELEDKMKGQIKSVGKRLGAIPNLIRELARGLGAEEEDIQSLIKAMRKISIKFAELEMLAPEHKVGMAKITFNSSQKQEGRSVRQIVNRFMTEGINNIITALFHYKSAMSLFFDEKKGIIYYLDLIMPVDNISQEDLTVALGEKPILFEERGFVFINEILPMSIEAVEGDPEKLHEIFDTIVQAVKREIFASDLGVRYLRNCADELRGLSTKRRLRHGIEKILEWKPAISVGAQLKEMLAKTEVKSTHEKLGNILDILKNQKEFENAIIGFQKSLLDEINRITRPAHVSSAIVQRLTGHLQTILSHLGSEKNMEAFLDARDENDAYFQDWVAHIKSQDDFIHWFRRLNQGKISERLEWVRETKWYQSVKKDYWRSSYKNAFWGKIISLFVKFEKVDEYDKVIERQFKAWYNQNIYLLGKLLVHSIVMGDNMAQPLHVFARHVHKVIDYDVVQNGERMYARWVFLQECQELTATLTPRDRIFSDGEHFSLEDRLVNRVIPALNNQVLATFLNDRLNTVHNEYRHMVRQELARRLEHVEAIDPDASLTHQRFQFLQKYFDHFLMGLVVLNSIGNPEEEARIRRNLLDKTWLFGGQKEPRTIEQEIDVFQLELLGELKDLWRREGILTREQVEKIEQEMPEEYQESIDALQVLMTWTMDPMKMMLLSEIDEQPVLMKAISKDGQLMGLLDKLAADSRVVPLVQELGNQPERLKTALQGL